MWVISQLDSNRLKSLGQIGETTNIYIFVMQGKQKEIKNLIMKGGEACQKET